MIEGNSWQAYAIRAVPGLLLLAWVVRGVGLLLRWDWDIELEPWLFTAVVLEPAVPVGLVAMVCLRVVWRRTAVRSSVMLPQLAAGASLLALAGGLAFISAEGAMFEERPGLPRDPADWAVAAAILASIASVVALLIAICYLYCRAITPEDSGRWAKRPAEQDAMGEILRSWAQ